MPDIYNLSPISVQVYAPIVRGKGWIMYLDGIIKGYTHEISADGWYTSAGIDIAISEEEVYDWLLNGLGRHIETYSWTLERKWEGYVDEISVTVNGVTYHVGPLSETANRTSVMYTPILTDSAGGLTDPPTLGEATETTIAEDTDSQSRYGKWEKILSVGNCFQDPVNGLVADEIRNTFLEENKYPPTDIDLSLEGEGPQEITVSLTCKGYIEWLSAYVYNLETTPLSVQLTTKIKNVLLADTNAIFSTNTDWLITNAALTSSYEADNRFARDILDEIVNIGDVNGNRWLLGVHNNRVMYYNQAPSTIKYRYRALNGQMILTHEDGAIVDPLDVQPGNWVSTSDLVVGLIREENQHEVLPTSLFIERMTYTWPNKVTLDGTRNKTLKQKLAFYGLGGSS